MNLSFSTRGWGDLSWEEMLQEAVDMRFGGVEVYNLFKFPALTDRGGPFHEHKVAATIRQLRDLKLKVPCFDTSVDLSSDPEAIGILTKVLETARNAQVPYVAACALTENEELVGENLEALLPAAEAAGVTLLLKTSGIYADTARLRSMLESFASAGWAPCGICIILTGTSVKVPTPPSRIWVLTSSMFTCETPTKTATTS